MTQSGPLTDTTAESTFAILICTKNRKDDLLQTLSQISNLISNPRVACFVLDDGSTDGTYEAVRSSFPLVNLQRNEVSKGYLFARNKLLNETTADYAISLDDDAHFLSADPLVAIEAAFAKNLACGVIAFRIFWGKIAPTAIFSDEQSVAVKSFVGCGHAWRMSAWRAIPNYPEWYLFYGEEDYASMQLFRIGLSVVYEPKIVVQHRVSTTDRRLASDFRIRSRRSLASGWYLYFTFYPLKMLPKLFLYSLAMQIKNKVLNGDPKAIFPIVLALFDLVRNIPKILKEHSRLSAKQYTAYKLVENQKIFWKPKPPAQSGE